MYILRRASSAFSIFNCFFFSLKTSFLTSKRSLSFVMSYRSVKEYPILQSPYTHPYFVHLFPLPFVFCFFFFCFFFLFFSLLLWVVFFFVFFFGRLFSVFFDLTQGPTTASSSVMQQRSLCLRYRSRDVVGKAVSLACTRS